MSSTQSINTTTKESCQFIFYNYFLLDPSNPGKYTYDDLNISFLYEPFYVGKAKYRSHKRCIMHFRKSNLEKNTHKNNKIKSLLNLGFTITNLKSYIIRINENSSESDAFEYEINAIKIIGRNDLKEGPLTNLTSGGDGAVNITMPRWNKGKKYKDIYGDNWISPCKGITMKERFGEDYIHPNTGKGHPSSTKGKTFKEIKGENYIHPNKGKSIEDYMDIETAKKLKEKMKLRMSGKNHPNYGKMSNFKKYIFVSPYGEKYNVIGSFNKFCKEHQLPSTMARQWTNKGPIPEGRYGKNNLYGWSIYLIE